MDFSVADASTTRKNVSLTFSADDVAKAIDRVVAERRKTLTLPGFRTGKVPAGLIEKRFGDELVPAATQQALDDALADVLKQTSLYPLSGVELDNPSGLFKRGEGYSCTMSFDVLPAIEFPVYEDLPVEQEKVVVDDADVDAILERLRTDTAELIDLPIARLPQDGDQAVVEYKGFDENGEALDDVQGQFPLVLGRKQALDDFENLVKTILPGEEKEGPVTFPADYAHKPLAGKTVTMRAKVISLKARKEPEIDDELAKKAGAKDLADLRKQIAEHLENTKKQQARSEAMQKLLDGLLAQVSFDLPQTLVETRVRRAVNEHFARQAADAAQPSDEERAAYADKVRPEIEQALRPQVFLMALARKENLEVKNEEVELQIYQMAMRAGQDYRKLSDAYRRAGLHNDIHDRVLADKAQALVYSKAKVQEVEPAGKATETGADA